MHKAISKAITVNIGHAEVELKFDWNAIATLEEKTGKSMPASLADLKDKPFATTRMFVWAGVQHQMPGTSLDEIGALMDFSATSRISASIMSAIGAQFGETGNKDGEADPNENRPIPING